MKKSCPKSVTKIKIPLYGGEVWLYLDKSKYVAAKLANGFDDEADQYSGETTTVVNEESGCVFLVGVFTDNLMQTLVHELAHVALFVCSSVGIVPTDSNGEPFCYLLDHLFGELAPVVAEKVMREGKVRIVPS